MAGNPFPSTATKISVADVATTPAWKTVGNMTSWDTDANDQLQETDVFMDPNPITTVGSERTTFRLGGVVNDSTDLGQTLIRAHIPTQDYFMIQVLWDGTNGFTAKVRHASRTNSGRAGNSLAEVQWTFSVMPGTITIAGTGPVI